jgi:hypothetical protein
MLANATAMSILTIATHDVQPARALLLGLLYRPAEMVTDQSDA